MGELRKPFQGIKNIIHFNWHFFIIAVSFIAVLLYLTVYTTSIIKSALQVVSVLIFVSILVSLFVSYYVYDLSGFYKFHWLENSDRKISVLNINAGFDETSAILKNKYKNANFIALDFYDANKHTEISIKRARKKYAPYPNTVVIDSSNIKLESNSIDKIFVILSAHEIRNKEERIRFFSELKRVLKPKGQLVIIEHLRDLPNFVAYNVGAFHFYSKNIWLDTFKSSKLKLKSEIKNTPFISTFILEKNGDTL